MKQQRGGTVLGLILGILIGLVLALVVAAYVNKVPVPFRNKDSDRAAEQDLLEQQKNRNWDPNAPLYGKALPAPASDVSASNGSALTSASAPETPVGTDPLGDLAQSRLQSPTAGSSQGGTDPFVYFVQIGAFGSQQDADSQRARLSLAGIETRVSQHQQGTGLIYRVRMGPFEQREQALAAQAQIQSSSGQSTSLVRAAR